MYRGRIRIIKKGKNGGYTLGRTIIILLVSDLSIGIIADRSKTNIKLAETYL